jgi:signal peptidase I
MSVQSDTKKKDVQPSTKNTEGGVAETVRVVFHALIIAIVIRTFLFQPFNIPSGSMIPTLLIGDYLFVSKYSYGYTTYSFPTSICVPWVGCTHEIHLFSGRIFGSQPKRGDVVVFRLPTDDSIDYIKRVIGLPGDKIQMIDGVLNINGQPIKREFMDEVYYDGKNGDVVGQSDPDAIRVARYRETLPNGVSYVAYYSPSLGFLDNTQVYTVPPDKFFMMGDNRDNSTDSRVLSRVGYVPYENIIGKAQIIFFSMKSDQPEASSE